MASRIVEVRRSVGSQFPALRLALRPAYAAWMHGMWRARNLLTGRRAVHVATSRGPLRMVAEGDIARYLWQSDFEAIERNFVESRLEPGMSVLNVGANAGLYTLMAGKLVGTTGEVHAFEPASVSYERLQRNIELNGLTNVYPNKCAVANVSGRMEVCRDRRNPGLDGHYSVATVSRPGCFVEATHALTLDEYWHRQCRGGRQPVDMIIVDVEGGEYQVLEGAREILDSSPDLMLLVECTERLSEIDDLMRAHGFAFWSWNVSRAILEPVEISRGNMIIRRAGADG